MAYEVGKSYLFRTVTHYLTGKLEAVHDQELVISTAAWIADTGRFHDCLAKGTLSEVEPMPGRVIIGRGSIVDVSEWNHPLPTVQK